MSSILTYTFRTNKNLEKIKSSGIKIFVFGKLKEDLLKFQQIIERVKPELVIGLAEVESPSRIEVLAINVFGKNKKVNKNGKDFYKLYIPTKVSFQKSVKPTTSFCNWTMYKISEFCGLKPIKISFIHFNKKDLREVLDFIKSTK